MTRELSTTVLSASAEARQPELLDVAIALLSAGRGRPADQVATLIDATTILLGAVRGRSADPIATDPSPARRTPRAKRARGQRGRKARKNGAAPIHDAAPAAGSAGGGQGSVIVSLTEGEETVEFNGCVTEVKARQARLFAALAPAMPNPVGPDFLIKKVWAGERVPASADIILGQLKRSCETAASSIGLELKTVRGVGIALCKAEG